MNIMQKNLIRAFENKRRHKKTYNSGCSPVVTHLATNLPVHCLNRAERTGSLVFNVLWSYVEEKRHSNPYDYRNLITL
jgi:hypothetical protein